VSLSLILKRKKGDGIQSKCIVRSAENGIYSNAMQCLFWKERKKDRVFILALSSVNVRVSTFKYFSVYFWGNGAETCSPPAEFPEFEFFNTQSLFHDHASEKKGGFGYYKSVLQLCCLF